MAQNLPQGSRCSTIDGEHYFPAGNGAHRYHVTWKGKERKEDEVEGEVTLEALEILAAFPEILRNNGSTKVSAAG